MRVIELFTILQCNTTLKALRVNISVFEDINVGPSLQNMLTLNKTLKCLAINSAADNLIPNNWSFAQHQSTGAECAHYTI